MGYLNLLTVNLEHDFESFLPSFCFTLLVELIIITLSGFLVMLCFALGFGGAMGRGGGAVDGALFRLGTGFSPPHLPSSTCALLFSGSTQPPEPVTKGVDPSASWGGGRGPLAASPCPASGPLGSLA